MIYSISRKFLYIHNPKTAGMSITKCIQPKNHDDMNENINFPWHMPSVDINNILIFNNIDTNDWFKFSFVRNPWDRVSSIYKFFVLNKKEREKPHNKKRAGFFNLINPRLNRNIHFMKTVDDKKIIDDSCKDVNDFDTFIECYDLFGLSDYEMFFDNKNNQIINNIYKFEELQKSWNIIKSKIKVYDELPHLHKSSGKEYKNYYSDKSIEIINNKFKWTIENFNYNY